MSDLLLQVGVGGIFCILVLREVFSFLQSRKNKDGNGVNHTIASRTGGIYERMWKVDKLYDWHDARDEEGVPIWYVRKSLEKAIEALATSIDVLKDSLREQNALLVRMLERMESLQEDISQLRQGQAEIEQVLRKLPEHLKTAK